MRKGGCHWVGLSEVVQMRVGGAQLGGTERVGGAPLSPDGSSDSKEDRAQ